MSYSVEVCIFDLKKTYLPPNFQYIESTANQNIANSSLLITNTANYTIVHAFKKSKEFKLNVLPIFI